VHRMRLLPSMLRAQNVTDLLRKFLRNASGARRKFAKRSNRTCLRHSEDSNRYPSPSPSFSLSLPLSLSLSLSLFLYLSIFFLLSFFRPTRSRARIN